MEWSFVVALVLLAMGCPGTNSTGDNDAATAGPDLLDLSAMEAVPWDLADSAEIPDQPVSINDCPQLAPFRNTANDAAAVLQKCIDDTPDGGTLELAVGYYAVSLGVAIKKPMTLRTLGCTAADPPCKVDGSDCARIVPTSTLVTRSGC